MTYHIVFAPARIAWTAVLGCLCALCLFSSCSETDDEEDNEYANWEERNAAYQSDIVAKCLANSDGQWIRLKSCYKDQSSEGGIGDYVYVHIQESGDTDGDSPMATDSVRVSYQGRLIPTKSYPEGFVFDGTVYGAYSSKTNATRRFLASGLLEGWTTALLHMHRGDYWRLYIPYEMGYGNSGNSDASIPGYSFLVFDLTLVDFSPIGQAMPVWSARALR